MDGDLVEFQGIYWDVVGWRCIGMYWDVLGCIGMYWDVLGIPILAPKCEFMSANLNTG